MRSFFNILSTLLVLSSTFIAFAQSNGAKPPHDGFWEGDEIICQRSVDAVTFIYGFIDGQWQALEKLEEEGQALLDCDEVYDIAPRPVS